MISFARKDFHLLLLQVIVYTKCLNIFAANSHTPLCDVLVRASKRFKEPVGCQLGKPTE
jgi:hypothetical protein